MGHGNPHGPWVKRGNQCEALRKLTVAQGPATYKNPMKGGGGAIAGERFVRLSRVTPPAKWGPGLSHELELGPSLDGVEGFQRRLDVPTATSCRLCRLRTCNNDVMPSISKSQALGYIDLSSVNKNSAVVCDDLYFYESGSHQVARIVANPMLTQHRSIGTCDIHPSH